MIQTCDINIEVLIFPEVLKCIELFKWCERLPLKFDDIYEP